MKKEARRPLANFSFTFIKKVASTNSVSTEYLVQVTPEADGDDSEVESDIETEFIQPAQPSRFGIIKATHVIT